MKKLIKKYGISRWQVALLSIFLFVALLNNFIANEKALLCKTSSGVTFFKDKNKCEWCISAPIPYSDNTLDHNNRRVGPFDSQNVESTFYRHWLGTDSLGRDILAGLIHGASLALFIGLLSSLLALFIGITMAYLSGYWGDSDYRISYRWAVVLIILGLISTFYLIYSPGPIKWLWAIAPILAILYFKKITQKDSLTIKRVSIPFDMITLRLVELFRSIPDLFIILIMLPLMGKPSYLNIIIIIALVRWPTITRHLRAEILNIKKENFVLSAKAIGLSDWHIFTKYILPLTISPIIIVIAFGFSSAVLLESTLSFLGIGVPIDQLTWGGILKEARTDFNSWWLAIFPGLCIYFLIYLFNSIGDRINEQLIRSNKLSGS